MFRLPVFWGIMQSFFLQMEAKISLARLLQQFKLTIPPDYKIVEVQRTVTQLKDDLICTLTQRM